MGGELQPALHRRPNHRHQPFFRDEEHAAIGGVRDPVNFTHSPRLSHVSAAREHAAVEEGFDPHDAQPIVTFLEQRVLAHLTDAG